jgi:3-deoxy-7-phosphoheptulonate synthase
MSTATTPRVGAVEVPTAPANDRFASVIIILQETVTEEQIQHVAEKVEQLGLQPSISRGTYRTVIGVIGDEMKLQNAPLAAIPGVAEVVPVMAPYKLASRTAHPKPTVVEVGSAQTNSVKIGGGYLGMIAGPCAVEAPERMEAIASAVRQAGANILRGGAFKPRTSPYSFQGLGVEGLKILRETGVGVRLRRHAPARRPEHAELRPADRSRQDK